MRVTIRDKRVLASLRPADVLAYLRSTGWQQASMQPGVAMTWVKRLRNGEEAEILLPLMTDALDFTARMAEVLHVLEVDEDRSQLDVLSDLSSASEDVIRVAIERADAADGTLPLEWGTQFIQQAQDMVTAAACSAAGPKAYYAARRPAATMEYLRKIRLGQTERGSYVVTILSRVPPALTATGGDPASDPDREPFERQVTITLATALRCVKHAAERAAATGNLDSFSTGINAGISANLCLALSGIRDDEISRCLRVRFGWARSRPLVVAVPDEISFSTDSLPVIREAGRWLRESAPREDFEIEGIVVQLSRFDVTRSGRITIFGTVDAQPRKITVELGPTEYDLAIKAHQDRLPVVCTGELTKEGRVYVLRNPRGFGIRPID